ncbi:DUF262 domain-containing protein [Mycoplasma struthionis]|uniref:GmrSD restriction endonucleases N-terminal domain-containing protein n=1 Tax=Mycoplasma struthionis TaxID=538220 RepID=A0A502M1Z8_9MOLU|nr:DUF262 domain-containing protein [Mycoplasma struthionis]TPI01176.1 hypothetical protein FJM01_03130 [Mycoplasma struthionis]
MQERKMLELKNIFVSEIFKEHLRVLYYKRNYCWSKETLNTFLNDIYDAFVSQKDSYWLGNITLLKLINKKNLEASNVGFEIIDGFQRIITVCFILRILENRLSSEKLKNFPILKTIFQQKRKILEFEEEVLKYFAVETFVNLTKEEFDKESFLNEFEIKNLNPLDSKLLEPFKQIFDFIDQKFPKSSKELSNFSDYFLNKVFFSSNIFEEKINKIQIYDNLNYKNENLSEVELIKGYLFLASKDSDLYGEALSWNNISSKVNNQVLKFIEYFLKTSIDFKNINENITKQNLEKIYLNKWALSKDEKNNWNLETKIKLFLKELEKRSNDFAFFINENEVYKKANKSEFNYYFSLSKTFSFPALDIFIYFLISEWLNKKLKIEDATTIISEIMRFVLVYNFILNNNEKESSEFLNFLISNAIKKQKIDKQWIIEAIKKEWSIKNIKAEQIKRKNWKLYSIWK